MYVWFNYGHLWEYGLGKQQVGSNGPSFSSYSHTVSFSLPDRAFTGGPMTQPNSPRARLATFHQSLLRKPEKAICEHHHVPTYHTAALGWDALFSTENLGGSSLAFAKRLQYFVNASGTCRLE